MPWPFAPTFLPRYQPWITRHCYRRELVTVFTFPVAMGLIEGGVIGVLAIKVFDVSNALFALIMAAPMFANVTSFFWARLARGKPKIRFINALQVLTAIGVALIALLPTTALGGVLLAVNCIIIRCIATGIVTLRSTVWRQNYPRAVRATVTGRLTLIQSLIMAILPLAGYALLDRNPDAFRYLYPASMVIALIGALSFAKIRLRGEKELLRYETQPDAQPQPHGDTTPIYEYDPLMRKPTFWSVLREDHFYRRYMAAQFVAGGANMMGEVVLIRLIANMTDGMRGEYFMSILLTTALPMLLAVVTLPFWARYLDRVHIAHFRARQSWVWVLDQSLNWIGAALGSLSVIAFARVIQGIVRGGGMLAWNLGHNDFANRRLVALYMGIHVTLTGVRGATVPFVGIWLYEGWSGMSVLGLHLPGWDGIGAHVFAVTVFLTLLGNFGYNRLSRDIRRREEKLRQQTA